MEDFNNAISEANLTGTYDGNRTLAGGQFDLSKSQAEIDNAMERINTMGYVDTYAAKITGLKEGTPSAQANQWKQEFDYRKQQDAKKK